MYRVALAFLLAGCSPVSRIANNTNEIRTQAQLLADHGMAINDPVVVTGATRIDTLAAGIHIALGGVEDKTPAWMSMLTWIAIAAVVVAVVVLLWQALMSMGCMHHGLLPVHRHLSIDSQSCEYFIYA